MLALAFPDELIWLLAAGTLWLIVPPTYLFAWAMAQKKEEVDDLKSASSQARIALAAIIGAVGLGAIAYRAIFAHQLQQTAALFVGIPTLMAIVVALFVSPQSAKGAAIKAVTVGLLVSLVFLGEGMLCVLMSAPIFYGVAIAAGAALDADRSLRNARFTGLLMMMLMPMSMEGVTEPLSFDRNETVSATRIVTAPIERVREAVLAPPRFDRALPVFLRAGFPRPTAVRIEGGNIWVVTMRGGEMRLNGMEPRAGDLRLRLDEAGPRVARWSAIADDSHMTHFLSWQRATVTLDPIDAQTTRVTWTLEYRRGLDPAWYFGPIERRVATLAAGYLIDAVATP